MSASGPSLDTLPLTRALEAALLLCGPLLAAVLALRPVDNFDLGFHLRLGELILAQGIPVTDPFSFPGEGQPWALEQWLGPPAFSLAYRLGGIAGCIVLKATIVFAAFLCVVLAARAVSQGVLAPAVATLLAAVSASPRFNVQPNVFSLLGLGLVLWALARLASGRAGRRVWLLVPLFLLWPHVHPGYLTGLAVLILFAGGAMLTVLVRDRLRTGALDPRLTSREIRISVALALFCGVVAVTSLVLIHPLGLAALQKVLSIFRSTTNRTSIAEYAPLWRSYSVNAPVLALLGLPLVVWAIRRRDVSLPLAAVFAFLALEALQVGRLVGEASMAAALVWGPAVEGLVDDLAQKGHLARLAAVLDPRRLALGVLALTLVASGLHLASEEAHPLDWTDGYYPHGCYAWIERNQLPPRAFNDLGFGGSWIFYFGTARKTFIDGRSFYNDDFFNHDYTPIKQASPGFGELVKKWGIEWYLLHPRRFRALHEALGRDPAFKLAHLEPNCAIYVPRTFPLAHP